jgi:hypothetical protein
LKCWICGAEANSAEHRFKKRDLVRAHGRGPYKDESVLVHFRNGKRTLVHGPESKTVKYNASLCHHCNTTLTQPFDQSYDQFVGWIFANEGTVLRRRFVDFEDVYGGNWEECQLNLYKYFAKSFGCRLVDAGRSVPNDVVNLLGKTHFQTGLRLTIGIHEDIAVLPPDIRSGLLGKGELFGCALTTDPTGLDNARWHEYVSWLTISYWYNIYPDGSCGATWVADGKFIYLGSIESLAEEKRLELIANANANANANIDS